MSTSGNRDPSYLTNHADDYARTCPHYEGTIAISAIPKKSLEVIRLEWCAWSLCFDLSPKAEVDWRLDWRLNDDTQMRHACVQNACWPKLWEWNKEHGFMWTLRWGKKGIFPQARYRYRSLYWSLFASIYWDSFSRHTRLASANTCAKRLILGIWYRNIDWPLRLTITFVTNRSLWSGGIRSSFGGGRGTVDDSCSGRGFLVSIWNCLLCDSCRTRILLLLNILIFRSPFGLFP